MSKATILVLQSTKKDNISYNTFSKYDKCIHHEVVSEYKVEIVFILIIFDIILSTFSKCTHLIFSALIIFTMTIIYVTKQQIQIYTQVVFKENYKKTNLRNLGLNFLETSGINARA